MQVACKTHQECLFLWCSDEMPALLFIHKTFRMTSKITIEVDFSTGNPYIRVINDRQSDDVRDKLISFFREKLGHTSSWCQVRFDDTAVSGRVLFEIHPIPPSALSEQSKIMTEQARLHEAHPSPIV
jgi:hypothetical protein